MTGMNRNTGFGSNGDDHLTQSIGDILSTPLGSRVMRRDYGSMLPELIDHPQNSTTRQLMIASTATALRRWEPRITLQKANVEFQNNGSCAINIEATRTDLNDNQDNERVRFTIPIQPQSGNRIAA